MGVQLPEKFTLQQAVTLPNNFVTVFHSVTADLGLELPWPKPDAYAPAQKDTAILVWGGASSVGQFALQILNYYGYTSILTTASKRHHDKLRSLGAAHTFDYNDADVVDAILNAAHSEKGVPLILDCIGSLNGSITPISKLAKKGSKVAILLPLVVKDSTEMDLPVYAMDVDKIVDWEEGVDARGVRTHFYLEVSTIFLFTASVIFEYFVDGVSTERVLQAAFTVRHHACDAEKGDRKAECAEDYRRGDIVGESAESHGRVKEERSEHGKVSVESIGYRCGCMTDMIVMKNGCRIPV